jgi:hypothetical protein
MKRMMAKSRGMMRRMLKSRMARERKLERNDSDVSGWDQLLWEFKVCYGLSEIHLGGLTNICNGNGLEVRRHLRAIGSPRKDGS